MQDSIGKLRKKVDLKQWKRWTELTKEFPKPKYNFSQVLRRRGDYVITHPMTFEERERFRWAAKFWAYTHNKRVKFQSLIYDDTRWQVKLTLVELHRKRDLPTL